MAPGWQSTPTSTRRTSLNGSSTRGSQPSSALSTQRFVKMCSGILLRRSLLRAGREQKGVWAGNHRVEKQALRFARVIPSLATHRPGVPSQARERRAPGQAPQPHGPAPSHRPRRVPLRRRQPGERRRRESRAHGHVHAGRPVGHGRPRAVDAQERAAGDAAGPGAHLRCGASDRGGGCAARRWEERAKGSGKATQLCDA